MSIIRSNTHAYHRPYQWRFFFLPLHHDAEIFLQHVAAQFKLKRVVRAMPLGTECILIVRRPEDNAIAFEAYGSTDNASIREMLEQVHLQIHGSRA